MPILLIEPTTVPPHRNALLRRYERELEAIGPIQFAFLILLGFSCIYLAADCLRDNAQGSKAGMYYRPGLDFYEAERRAAERAKE